MKDVISNLFANSCCGHLKYQRIQELAPQTDSNEVDCFHFQIFLFLIIISEFNKLAN